jgi:CYTH domain-containing protein
LGSGRQLTVKGERQGIARPAFEYEISVSEAEEMLEALCVTPVLEKIRHRIEHGGLIWDIDAFSGAAEGRVLAEVEPTDVDQRFDLPIRAGAEVTFDRRYRNTSIAKEGAPRRPTPEQACAPRKGCSSSMLVWPRSP